MPSIVSLDQAKTTVGSSACLKEKFEKFEMDNQLTASFLAGMVEPHGAAKYLLQKRDAFPTVHRALHHVLITGQQTLNFSSANLMPSLDFSVLSGSAATHVLTGITWGGRIIVTVTRDLNSSSDKESFELRLDEAFQEFEQMTYSDYQPNNPFEDEEDDETKVKIYSDIPDYDEEPPRALKPALRYAKGLQKRMESVSSGYGKPIIYTLLPVGFFITLGAVILDDTAVGQLSGECIEKYVTLLDDLGMVQQSLMAYHKRLRTNSSVVRAEHLTEVQNKLMVAQKAEVRLRSDYAQMLSRVRCGQSSSYKVWQLIEETLAGEAAPGKLLDITDEYADKLEFISMAVNRGAKYLTLDGPAMQSVRASVPQTGTAYVFFFNSEVMSKDGKWEEHVDLLQKILDDRQRWQPVLLADCCSNDDPLERVLLSVYTNGGLKTKDLLADNRILAAKHLLGFMDSDVEKVDNIPAHRRALVIPCPCSNCDPNTDCEWTCCRCHVETEYSPADGYFYCECGKIQVERVGFNCQRPGHGTKYAKYPPGGLKKLLKGLPPPPEVNILILGETGVGKSTFINAFVNYLTFSTLDEGLEAPRLNWVIPCSFTTQVTDSNTGRLISKSVKIGSDKDEQDGSKGASATQQATVYPIYIGGTLVRLIDTPGIGDTRGQDQDRENLANVLSVLRNYPDLHGILILLKPNNARLNVMFRFCVKELLSSLHRSAAENIAFGFTNTRGSDYKPGDTFTPLQALLSEYKDVIPGLYDFNVYCFDSESFRYLAAQKQGINMGTIADYRRSWDQSTKEADRLMAYFRTLAPHHTQRTLSLNETRHLIAQLTAPMQQISRAITDSIAASEKQAQDLANTQLTGNALRSKLHIQKVVVKATNLSKPKTVCSNESCVTPVKQSESGGTVLLRKNLCHNPCCLTNVPVGRIGTPELVNCAAFSGQTCMVCRHKWQEHEHIMVEYSQNSESTTDPQVQTELNENGNLVKAKEAQIKALERHIAELKNEHQFIQEAAAKFSVYMKKNSITHYNDATIEYMDHLIKDEKSKLRGGESRARLDRLERDKAQYQTYVDAMEAGKRTSGKNSAGALDERGVASLVQQLYNLKHYGHMLKDLAKVVGKAYAANFRERPYRIQGKRFWMETPERSNGQLPVLRLAKRQQRQSMLIDLDDDPVESNSRGAGARPLTSRLRKTPPRPKSEMNDMAWSPSQFSNSPGMLPPPIQEEAPAQVKSISDWLDEEPSQQGEEPTPQDEYLDEKGTRPNFPGRFSSMKLSRPPPYSEDPYDMTVAPFDTANGGQKHKLWTRIKSKLRK